MARGKSLGRNESQVIWRLVRPLNPFWLCHGEVALALVPVIFGEGGMRDGAGRTAWGGGYLNERMPESSSWDACSSDGTERYVGFPWA